ITRAAPSPRGELEAFFNDATAALAVATDSKRARDEVRERARHLFDGQSAARQALGSEWDQRTGPEREEFTRTFTNVLELAYIRLVEGRLPRDRPPTIRILGERVDGARDAMVPTIVEARDGSDVRLDYVMSRPEDAWRVRDV